MNIEHASYGTLSSVIQ